MLNSFSFTQYSIGKEKLSITQLFKMQSLNYRSKPFKHEKNQVKIHLIRQHQRVARVHHDIDHIQMSKNNEDGNILATSNARFCQVKISFCCLPKALTTSVMSYSRLRDE